MRGFSIAIFALLFVCGTACNTMPKGTLLVTCKPVVRQQSVGWREGSSGTNPLATHGSEAIAWPTLILQDARYTRVIHFADRRLLNMLKTNQVYTFAILPPTRDERGATLPQVLWVKQDGKRIYSKK